MKVILIFDASFSIYHCIRVILCSSQSSTTLQVSPFLLVPLFVFDVLLRLLEISVSAISSGPTTTYIIFIHKSTNISNNNSNNYNNNNNYYYYYYFIIIKSLLLLFSIIVGNLEESIAFLVANGKPWMIAIDFLMHIRQKMD